ncbi:CPBP family intramembrane glutamic endopeptidase, partial [Nocardiopsis dassonvillei]|uniref:CPBP family intramembrane glutamic endopeptidase n=1 Tax=Nocardiopsis dassonvillei TaxID=2014 RepID=UPI002283E753
PEPERDRGLLAPRTTAERAMAAGVAVTGGVFGELLYRGLFILLVASMGVPLWVAAVLSVLLFSVAHLYQGWWGLVSAGASGALFTVLYLGTGSVWVPVLVHVALNLRSLVFPPADVREAGERYEEGGDPEAYDGYDEYEDHGHGYEDGPATGELSLTAAEEDGGADTAVPPGTGPPAHGTPYHGAVSGYGDTPGHGGPPVYGGLPDQGGNPGHGDPADYSGDPGHSGHSAYGDLPAQSRDFGSSDPYSNSAPYSSSGPHSHGGTPAHGGPPGHGDSSVYGDLPAQNGPYTHGAPYRHGDLPVQGDPYSNSGTSQQDLYSGLSTAGPSSGYGDRFGGGDPVGYGGHRPDAPSPDAPLYPGASRPEPLSSHRAPGDPSRDDLPGGDRRGEDPAQRRLYPDEWIDRRYGDGNTTPGPDPDRWS